MKIVFLDAKTIGDDIDLSGFDSLGEVTKYNFTTPEEAPERVKDADVLIINKVPINENTVGTAKNLKLVCVTATGTNNLDKDYLDSHKIAWRNVAGYSTETVTQHTFAMLFYLLEKLRYYDDYVKDGNYINDTSFTHFAEHFSEINGKTWGIIGLGAIGQLVANAATHLGMEVYGYDPYISVNAAWNLSRSVKHISNVEDIYKNCDVITIHVPLLDSTKKMINADAIAMMKPTAIVLNFARDLLVDEEAMVDALAKGKVKKYVSDFPNNTTVGAKGCIVTPHLGASTAESEDNCAVMAVKELRDYLENGNIVHSVNFPDCSMGACTASGRVGILHKNVKGMIGQITTALAEADINVSDLTNKGKGDYAYSLLDLDSAIDASTVEKLSAIDGVLRVRVIK